jgi:hypothetical protein
VTPLKTLILITMLPLAAACHRRGADPARGAQTTQTIPPAAAKPAPNDSEALTQTVDVEDSRSEAEGGVTNAPAKKAPPAVAKKKKK